MDHKRFLELGGNTEIPQAYFNANIKPINRLINYYTFDRIDINNEEHVSRKEECIVELMQFDYQNKVNDDENGNIKSESVGSHRVDYNVQSVSEKEAQRDSEKYEIIKKYFGHTGLMYRGTVR